MADEKDEQASGAEESTAAGTEIPQGEGPSSGDGSVSHDENVGDSDAQSGDTVLADKKVSDESTEEQTGSGTQDNTGSAGSDSNNTASDQGDSAGKETVPDPGQVPGGSTDAGSNAEGTDGDGDVNALRKDEIDPTTINADYAQQLAYQVKLLAANKGTRVLRVAVRDYEVLNIHGLMNGPSGVMKDSEVTVIADDEIRPGTYTILE